MRRRGGRGHMRLPVRPAEPRRSLTSETRWTWANPSSSSVLATAIK